MKHILVTASVLALLASPALAQSNSATPSSQSPSGVSSSATESSRTALNQQDHTFVQQAAEGGLAEVEMGRLAEQKATDPAVQEFGRWMVTDHEMANRRLKAIASREKVTVPNQMSSTQHSEYQKLQGLSGSQFDHQYMQGQLQAHQKTVALFEQQDKSGENRALKTFARQTLPMLRAHLQEAEILTKGGGVASNPSRTMGSGSSAPPAHSAH